MRLPGGRHLWLAAVVICFCVPLFVGLGRTDMENDEAIYSYAVDGILATGDWLNPPLSPHPDWTFLEKPPLKFWIVAAPIAAGLLPHNEIGMRVWDALFGAMAFVYVFAFGRRLAGPVCGFIAVLVLFLYQPLLFNHGIRNNNMEAPLVLCYCGGIYHFAAWASATTRSRRRAHIAAVYAYFFLGFMTKFVAAFFLPVVLGLALLVNRPAWRRLREDLGMWLIGALVTLAIAAPWFIYQMRKEGMGFWRVLVGEHVYQRFTSSLDKSHLQPWHFYFSTVFKELETSGTIWIVGIGVVLLLVVLVRERKPEQWLTVLWFLAPVGLISLGTSKIHHYVYPFLPAIALAAGFGTAWLLRVGQRYAVSAINALQQRFGGMQRPSILRGVLLGVAGLAVVLAVATFVVGNVEWQVGDTRLFRNSHVARPLAVAMVLALIAGRGEMAARFLWPLALLLAIVPLNAYEGIWRKAREENHPVRTARDCMMRVQKAEREAGRPGPGVYAIGEHTWFLHTYFYYLRPMGWDRADTVNQRSVDAAMVAPGMQRPIMMQESAYREIRHRYRDIIIPMVPLTTVLLLTPGPYGECGRQPDPAYAR
jgi:4-amino-4-deoxy-L-arabinose transferase-like glycosyltransferase